MVLGVQDDCGKHANASRSQDCPGQGHRSCWHCNCVLTAICFILLFRLTNCFVLNSVAKLFGKLKWLIVWANSLHLSSLGKESSCLVLNWLLTAQSLKIKTLFIDSFQFFALFGSGIEYVCVCVCMCTLPIWQARDSYLSAGVIGG